MRKPKSRPLLDQADFPISLIRCMMVRATGTELQELSERPMVAIVNSHTELNPGHMHLSALAQRVKEGVHAAGGIPFEFNVPAPCDGMTEGHEGMRFILPQRELIADIIETHARSMLFDGLVMIASCDKIIPGMIMAAARLDLPAIMLTGGPNAFQNRFMGGEPGTEENMATCGACDIMGTANTFQCLAEAMGLTLPGSANVPAFHVEKLLWARRTGRRIVEMIEEDLTASRILTQESLHNALVVDLAIGGSTNAALHLPAIAHELGLALPLCRFNELNRRVPTLLAIRPNGPYGIVDLYAAGGIPAVMKVMADDLHLDALTASGRPWRDHIQEAKVLNDKVIPSRDNPYFKEGATAVLYGNLAPEGAVVKHSAVAQEMLRFSGPARVMDSEAQALKAFREGTVNEGEVLVIRYEGPRGGPGMPETLAVTMALVTSGLKRVALVTDGRFSGATSGPCVGHVCPEAHVRGPIAALRDGDVIEIDIPQRRIQVQLSDHQIRNRLRGFRPPEREIPAGFMRRYSRLVGPASRGAVLE